MIDKNMKKYTDEEWEKKSARDDHTVGALLGWGAIILIIGMIFFETFRYIVLIICVGLAVVYVTSLLVEKIIKKKNCVNATIIDVENYEK